VNNSLSLTDLLWHLARGDSVDGDDRPLPRPPPDVPFNDWLARMTDYHEAWITAHADEDVDCYWCGKTHRVGRLYPEGGCAGPAPPPKPQPVALEPEPEPEPEPFRRPPNFAARARPSGSRPSGKNKKLQTDLEAEWESFRVHRTSLRGDF
jgi:hypothetical protein